MFLEELSRCQCIIVRMMAATERMRLCLRLQKVLDKERVPYQRHRARLNGAGNDRPIPRENIVPDQQQRSVDQLTQINQRYFQTGSDALIV
ncbi:MAG: hypothetical protein EOO81_03510 [Oxalobacteraceae bacterium]|nr:MAG: hypothetical protein EOO81_03510 [Oxalobacteraceae bacterium]